MLWPLVHHSHPPVTHSSHASSFSASLWGAVNWYQLSHQPVTSIQQQWHTPSLWVYYLAAVFVNTIMSLVLRAPQTPDHRPVFADSSDSSASSAFQSQKSHFPPSPLPASGPRGGIFLAAAQSRTPSITKSPRGVEVPKTFWQDSDIATSAVKDTLSSLHSLVPPGLNGFIVSEGFWRSEQKYLQSRFDRKFCND